MRTIVDYDKNRDVIRNLDALPGGLGCKYLLAIESPYPCEYVAKQWKRKMPANTNRGEVIIRI
jgi:hypothetical protein